MNGYPEVLPGQPGQKRKRQGGNGGLAPPLIPEAVFIGSRVDQRQVRFQGTNLLFKPALKFLLSTGWSFHMEDLNYTHKKTSLSVEIRGYIFLPSITPNKGSGQLLTR